MPIKRIHWSGVVGGDYADLDGITSIETTETYKQPCARFRLECEDTGSFGLNDYITLDIGFTTDHAVAFKGYIDNITTTRRPGIYEVTGRDILKRAIEHWIVTTDIENPWSRSNISAENLVRDLLAEAGITSYSGKASSFTFGVSGPAEFQIISSWDAIEKINRILAWTCYAVDDTVYFDDTQPTPGTPDFVITVGDDKEIEQINYDTSTENLRNKVIVFGKDGLYAEDSAVSPYLPAGFYKTAIVSSELIDTQQMADDAAAYNLALYNRLTETLKVDIEGNANIRARDTVTVTEPFTGVNSNWFVYSVQHRVDENGFTSSLHLMK